MGCQVAPTITFSPLFPSSSPSPLMSASTQFFLRPNFGDPKPCSRSSSQPSSPSPRASLSYLCLFSLEIPLSLSPPCPRPMPDCSPFATIFLHMLARETERWPKPLATISLQPKHGGGVDDQRV